MAGLPVPSYGQPVRFGPQAAIQNNPLQLLLALISTNQQGQNEARQANESRYNDILQLLGENRQRTLGALNDFGTSLVNDANKTYTDKRNNLITDLADRGLSGSTKRIAVENATQREKDAAVNRIKDMLIQDRTGADLGFTDRATGVMERRSDPYPQTGDIGGLISQLVGAFPGSLGGANQGPQPHYYGGSAPSAYAVGGTAPQTADDVNAQRAAKKASQDASANDVARQNALAALTTAMRKGGVEGEDATRQALTYLQQNGWAQQNPTQGTPQINFGHTIQPSYAQPSGGTGGPQYRTPLWQRDPTFASRLSQMGLQPWNDQSTAPGQPGQFAINGPQSSTNSPQSGGLSPLGQLAGIFNFAGAAGRAVNPNLGALRSYVGY